MQNEIKTPPTLEFYWKQELESSATVDNEQMKDKEPSSVETIKDNFGKTGSVVKWTLPVPDETTARRLVDETKEIDDPASEFSAVELPDVDSMEINTANEQLINLYATSNYVEGIF
jgi:hypothetical protein